MRAPLDAIVRATVTTDGVTSNCRTNPAREGALRMKRFSCILAAALFVPSIALAANVPITACETTVNPGDTGVLQADLDCSGSPFGVRMLIGTTLDLNGHTIGGGATTFATVLGVNRAQGKLRQGRGDGPEIGSGGGDFTIVGPGGISGSVAVPPEVTIPACVLINGGHVHIIGGTGRVDIAGCGAGVLGSSGIVSNKGRVELEKVDFHGGGSGPVVKTLTASDVTVHDTVGEVAVSVLGKAHVTDVSVHDNPGNGLTSGQSMDGSGVVATNNGVTGIFTRGTMQLSNVTASGNQTGAAARLVQLTDSTLTGNGASDITSFRHPLLTNVTCNHSTRRDGSPWGVCADD
jgi:hypothetical protein